MLAHRLRSLPTLSPSMQHYLRTIHEVQGETGHARVTDVAHRLGVGKAAVSLALRGLKQRGLVRHKHYQVVELTEAGAVEARRVMARFTIVRQFLEQVLGITPPLADRDACLLEHYVSSATVDRLVDMIRFFEQPEAGGRPVADRFRDYHRACASDSACPPCELHCDAALA
jgi:DtxR family transcriptional regulator, Mn-dependent transcriptional regulator